MDDNSHAHHNILTSQISRQKPTGVRVSNMVPKYPTLSHILYCTSGQYSGPASTVDKHYCTIECQKQNNIDMPLKNRVKTPVTNNHVIMEERKRHPSCSSLNLLKLLFFKNKEQMIFSMSYLIKVYHRQ